MNVVGFLWLNLVKRKKISRYGEDILDNERAAGWFLFWIVIAANVIGWLIGVTMLVGYGALPFSEFGIALAAWIVGDAILLLVLFPAMSRYLTPVVKRAGLLVDYLF